ncbi:hypothetical protein F6R98_05020 [Candidatus Methylospira mobilis]|uniref:Uncharacterized protein n=1 Tax=Candidatus Methylospira mobilis TaxID=1808979 RepID=A0A5Q0BIV2_9GAMM|nr:hypothetical protein [Candidatus Methylospira mobilis]QFY42068.1 hypothetical protein F6R98_05020 [Candidatus Methylospira mobilis]
MSNEPNYTAVMLLPKGGKQAWTDIMQGSTPVSNKIYTGTPIVMAISTAYADGTRVVGGVLKSENPTECNYKFMWAFDKNGNQCPFWPIDVGDHEDFYTSSLDFSLEVEGVEQEYLLNIVEADS